MSFSFAFTETGVDFTLVTTPAVIDQTGDVLIAAYKGRDDPSAPFSFGRQLRTGGTNDGLPLGSAVEADPPTGCAARLQYHLPPAGGLNRTGVFYSEAIKNNVTTRIQTVILPGKKIQKKP